MISGHSDLLSRLAGHTSKAHAGEGLSELLVIVRMRKLAAIEEMMGRAAVEHLLAHVRGELERFSGGGNLVVPLEEAAFAVVRAARLDDAEDLAHRMVSAVSRRVSFGSEMLYAPANAGVCLVGSSAQGVEGDLERALGALQQAMARGPGCVEVASEARVTQAVEDWEMRTLLEEASIRRELHLEYQTIQAPLGGPVLKVEALMRWVSPRLGRVRPDVFIPLLEDSGAIGPIGEWALREAGTQLKKWREETGSAIRMAVNVSPIQLASGDFVAAAQRAVEESGCEASWIELEVTEGALIRSFTQVQGHLQQLAALGFTLAIDDFGAGYSSLGQLAQLPVHHLKMDRSLITGLPDGSKRAGVVKAVVALAEALGLAVTAEGVELHEQADWLGRFEGINCQGYLFSRPLLAESMRELIVAGVKLPPRDTTD